MFDAVKEEVCRANLKLLQFGLVKLTWGNASAILREEGLVVIKPSGLDYDIMAPEHMVVVDLDGKLVEGKLRPSSDLPTHLELYRGFPGVGGIVHTHSVWATSFAQAERSIPCYGTTHADNFHGAIPCSRLLSREETESAYEWNTGRVIVETFTEAQLDPLEMPGIIVGKHGPFAWGGSVQNAVENALVLEEVAHLAWLTEGLLPQAGVVPDYLIEKHYKRKHGPNAYYGQK
jgi:L-ribulose-5-phosphate 4-epimerase